MATEPTKKFLFAADVPSLRRCPQSRTDMGFELREELREKYDNSEPAVFFNFYGELTSGSLEELCESLDNSMYYTVQCERVSPFSPMVAKLDEVVKDRKMDSFAFLFITDGRFKGTYDELLHTVKNSDFFYRITNIHFFMFGNGMPGKRSIEQMLSIFQGIPAEVAINNIPCLKKQDPLWKDGDDIMLALKSLEQGLGGSDVSSEIKVSVRESLDVIEKYYSNQMLRKLCLEIGAEWESQTDTIRKLFRKKDTQKVTQFTSALSRAQTSDPVFMKIQKLYRKLSKGCGEAYHPMHFKACKMALNCLSDYVGFCPPETPRVDNQNEQEPAFPEVEEIAEEVHENLEVADKPEEVNAAQDADTQPSVSCQDEGTGGDAEGEAVGTATEADIDSAGKHTQIVAEKVDLPTTDKEGIHSENDRLSKIQISESDTELNDQKPKEEPCDSEHNTLRPEATPIPESSENTVKPEEESEEERQFRRSDTVEANDADQPGTSAGAGQEANEDEPKNEDEDNNEDNQENNDEQSEDEEEREESSEMFEKAKYWNSEDDQHLLNSPSDPQRLCAVFQIESKVHVIQMQTATLSKVVFNDYRNLWLQRYTLQECPFRIFDLIDSKNIENLILSDHVSAESYIHTVFSTDEGYNEAGLQFRSTCTLNVYPIFVYNFANPNNTDLSEDKTSELYAERTEFDEYVVESLCAVLLQQFLSMSSISGNKPLWAIAFLYMIYNTKRIQENSFLEECVRNTILRISIVFECNVPLFPDMYPKLSVPIIDAFTCITKTSNDYCTSSEGCVFCKIGKNSIVFVNMLQNIFHLKPPQVKCWALRISSDYLSDVYMNKKAKPFLETIVRTKVQDWIDTEEGPLLLGGKTNEDVYNDSLKLTNGSALLRILKCLKNRKTPTDLKTFVDQLLDSNETLYSEDLSYDVNLLDHVKICRSTCRPISVCPATKMPWKRCLSPDANKSELSFFNAYGKFCRKFKFYPYTDDLLSFLVKQYPNKMFYNNTEKILEIIAQKFEALNIDVADFNERFKDSHSPAKRLEIERNCPCPAHQCPETLMQL